MAPASTRKASQAYGWLPHAVALDSNINAPTLALLAYRVTFAGNHALNEHHLLRETQAGRLFSPEGAGRDVIRRTITALPRHGLTERKQAGHQLNGRYGFAREKVTDKGTATKADGQHVKRWWFTDLGWSLKEAGAILWLRSHGPASISDLAQRFGYHRETAGKLIARLVTSGHAVEVRPKGANRRLFKCKVRRQNHVGNHVNGVENPGNGDVGKAVNGDVGNPGNTRILRSDSHTLRGKKHISSGGAAPLAEQVPTTSAQVELPSSLDSLPAVEKDSSLLAKKESSFPAAKKEFGSVYLPMPPAGKGRSLKAEAYRRGERLFGPRSGGLITRALRELAALAAEFEQCADMDLVAEVHGLLDYAESADNPRAAFVALLGHP